MAPSEVLSQAVEAAYEAGLSGEEIDAIVSLAISHAQMIAREQ